MSYQRTKKQKKMDIQVWDNHLIYDGINILDITAEYIGITTKYTLLK